MLRAERNGHSNIVRCLARTIWPDRGVNGIPADIQNFRAGWMTIRTHIERSSARLSVNTIFRNHEYVNMLPDFASHASPYGDDSGSWGKIKGYLNGPRRCGV